MEFRQDRGAELLDELREIVNDYGMEKKG
jgi:hypothetical protein